MEVQAGGASVEWQALKGKCGRESVGGGARGEDGERGGGGHGANVSNMKGAKSAELGICDRHYSLALVPLICLPGQSTACLTKFADTTPRLGILDERYFPT